MEELKEEQDYGICKTVKLEAKMQSLQMAEHLNEQMISISAYSKKELLRDAQEIYSWLLNDL